MSPAPVLQASALTGNDTAQCMSCSLKTIPVGFSSSFRHTLPRGGKWQKPRRCASVHFHSEALVLNTTSNVRGKREPACLAPSCPLLNTSAMLVDSSRLVGCSLPLVLCSSSCTFLCLQCHSSTTSRPSVYLSLACHPQEVCSSSLLWAPCPFLVLPSKCCFIMTPYGSASLTSTNFKTMYLLFSPLWAQHLAPCWLKIGRCSINKDASLTLALTMAAY